MATSKLSRPEARIRTSMQADVEQKPAEISSPTRHQVEALVAGAPLGLEIPNGSKWSRCEAGGLGSCSACRGRCGPEPPRGVRMSFD